MAQTSDCIARHYQTADHDSGYYSYSSSTTTTSTSMPSLVSITSSSSSGVSEPFPQAPSTPSTSASGVTTSTDVTLADLLARRRITWAPLPEKACSPASNTGKQQQDPSTLQHQSQPKAVSRGRSKTIKSASTSRTKARTPTTTTIRASRTPAVLEYGSEITPTRAGRRTWKQPVQPLPPHQRQSKLTALIHGSKVRQTAPENARKGVSKTWAGITACSYGELKHPNTTSGTTKETDWVDDEVTTTATSHPIAIPLDRWGRPNHHLAAETTWKDGHGTKYLADGTKAELTVNSFGERMPVEIATWGDYWGNYTLRYEEDEEVEDWSRDYWLW